MKPAAQSIRVYASGRKFVVVPLVERPDEHQIEAAPAHHVNLTLGRPAVLTLTKAIRSARERSTAEPSGSVVAWDGEDGRWWVHHLLSVTVTWEASRIVITSGPRMKANAGASVQEEAFHRLELPTDTPASDIAEWLIRHLGERLHSG